MKNQMKLLLCLFFFGLLACSKEEFRTPEAPENGAVEWRDADSFFAAFELAAGRTSAGNGERCPDGAYQSYVGSGSARPFGETEAYFSHCIQPAGSGFETLRIQGGRGTIITAGGDELRLAYTGTFSGFAQARTGRIELTYTVSGGTGRFAGAEGSGSGEWVLIAMADEGAPVYRIAADFHGRLDYGRGRRPAHSPGNRQTR